jgi:hypothetical protein
MSNPYVGNTGFLCAMIWVFLFGLTLLISCSRFLLFPEQEKHQQPAWAGRLLALLSLGWLSPPFIAFFSVNQALDVIIFCLLPTGLLLCVYSLCRLSGRYPANLPHGNSCYLTIFTVGVTLITLWSMIGPVETVDNCPSNHDISVLSSACPDQ